MDFFIGSIALSKAQIREYCVFFLVSFLLLLLRHPGCTGSVHRGWGRLCTCRLIFNYLECHCKKAYRLQQQQSNSISLQLPWDLVLCACWKCIVCVWLAYLFSARRSTCTHWRGSLCICVSRWQEWQGRVSGRRVITAFTVTLYIAHVCGLYPLCIVQKVWHCSTISDFRELN